MTSLATAEASQWSIALHDKSPLHKHANRNSAASSAWTTSSTVAERTFVSASTHLTSPSLTPSLASSSSRTGRSEAIEMTTYFHYDQDGNVHPSAMPSPGSQPTWVPQASDNQQGLNDPVGAYLARRNALAAASTVWQAYPTTFREGRKYYREGQQPMAFPETNSAELDCSLHEECMYESSIVNIEYSYQYGPTSSRKMPEHVTYYPDLDEIRRHNTLQSLLPLIPPERRVNTLQGPRLDIVEAGTDIVFASHVPKKMLVLFLGREVVKKFIRTIEREDNVHWSGPPVVQVLRIPQGIGSAAAFKILFSWMFRACSYHNVHDVWEFKVPQNMYAACTLAQILVIFRLQLDARRVEHTIMNNHFKRPIFADELEVLWNCLGEHNQFVCVVIKVLKDRLWKLHSSESTASPMWKEIREMLIKYPTLKARLFDLHPVEGLCPGLHTESSHANRCASGHQQSYDSNHTKFDEVENSLEGKPAVRKAAVLRIVLPH